MNHKQKLKLARKLQGKPRPGYSAFESSAWESRKENIAKDVKKKEAIAKKRSEERKLRILDDKGKEHKVGEIFESETLTLEV